MFKLLEGFTPYREEDVALYLKRGWWPNLTLGDLLDRAADIHPEKEGFVDTNGRLTYGETREKVNKLAIGMIELGIQPLERVLVQIPNWNEFVLAYFACQKIGAIPVLLIDRYRQYEINHLAEISGATVWFVPTRYKKNDFIPIIDDVRRNQPLLRNVITVRGEISESGFSSLDRLIEGIHPTPRELELLEHQRPDPMQVAHMGPTGGTTGAPKIVPRTHNSLVCSVGFCSASWEQHCEDVNLIVNPVAHDLSFSKAFLGSIITQGRLVMLDSTENADICETIQRERVTAIVWVPALAQRLLQFEALNHYDLSSLRKMHSGGGASHPEMIRDVMERLKMRFHNGYGGTEGMTCITRCTDDLKTICGTVGRPTFPYDIYKAVDGQGKELPPDTSGELLVKGPCVFTGYYNNPEENARVFDKEGFFRTGDLARISEKGYITLTGRVKEMINRGGESISATEIEKLINRHPDVAVVAVVPMPDAVLGERVCAYIELLKGASLTFEEVIAFLKDQKAAVLQLPERIEFVNSIPVTGANKIDKQALCHDIKQKLVAETA
ncbi:MAG: AMP-binding protein [Deltaproteobacteria bacterium]|nr:AMP-binding protein [Deltaproteobacteria bacterium]